MWSVKKCMALIVAAMALSACHNGGDLTLEPGARSRNTTGSPYVQVNLGGKSMIVEQGKTPSTGVHGWLSVNAVSSTSLSSTNGTSLILNRSQAVH